MKKIGLFFHRLFYRFTRAERLTEREEAFVLIVSQQEAKPWAQVKDELGW